MNKQKIILIFIIISIVTLAIIFIIKPNIEINRNLDNISIQNNDITYIMKDVGLYTPLSDLKELKSGGIDVITTEWGVGEDDQDIIFEFLDNVDKAGLKVIMDGGFSATAWGYDWDNYESTQKPVWQKAKMQQWILDIKDHPAVYGYDIANEFGENLPIPQEHPEEDKSWIKDYGISKDHLNIVKKDIYAIDSTKPLILRIHDWDLNDEDYSLKEKMDKDLVDIIMLNMYTNWSYENADEVNINYIENNADKYIEEIKKVDSNIEVWVAIASFEDKPYFTKPSKERITSEINQVTDLENVTGLGFFGLGWTPDETDTEENWYLLRDGIDLWESIKLDISNQEDNVKDNNSFTYKTPKIGQSYQLDFSPPPLNMDVKADIYEIDYYETPKETIEKLHNNGIHVLCYINVGAWEEYRDDANQFPDEIIGNDYEGWEGEKWLDIHNYKKFSKIIEKRFDLAKAKGCDGIEPDNIQGYQENTGFDLSYTDQLKFNQWIAKLAHERSMSIGLKNDPDQVNELVDLYDWALIEDCHVWNFCEEFTPFIKKNKPVFQVEYTDQDLELKDFCSDANDKKFTAILKNRDLDSWINICK